MYWLCRHIVALLVMLNIVFFSYHKLLDLEYDHRTGKTTTAKRLAVEKNISVWVAERQLDTKLFLDEIPKWEPGRPHCLLLNNRCLHMLRWLDWRNTIEGSTGDTGNHPQKEAPRQRFPLWGYWLHKQSKRRSWPCTRKSISSRGTLGKSSAQKIWWRRPVWKFWRQ